MYKSLICCSKCGEPLVVNDSRKKIINGVETVWRRRRCKPCDLRKRSIELPEDIAKKVLALLEKNPKLLTQGGA